MNRGAQKMKDLGIEPTDVARICRVSRQTVHNWYEDLVKPSAKHRGIIEDEWPDVTWRLWDETEEI